MGRPKHSGTAGTHGRTLSIQIVNPNVNLSLSDEQVEIAIKALDYYARMEAGHTQEPDLCVAEDFEEFDLARVLEQRLAKSRVLRTQWVLDPHDGVKYRLDDPTRR